MFKLGGLVVIVLGVGGVVEWWVVFGRGVGS